MKTKGIFGLLGVIIFLTVLSTTVAAIPFYEGDIFVGSGNGGVTVYDSTGRFLQILNTESRSIVMTGMCFDDSGNLYTTNFNDRTMSKFDNNGLLLTYPWGGPFSSLPETCVVDHYGNIYTVEVGETNTLRKFDNNGILLGQWNPTTEDRINFIDLHADQKTMYYTTYGSSIKRYDVSTGTQLADFATGLNGPCFALRILANGEVLVTCHDEVYRLDRFGSVLQTYPKSNYGEASNLVFLALDPDGNSFWTAALTPFESPPLPGEGSLGGNIYKIDFRTGNLLTSFHVHYSFVLGGLAIFGEPTVAKKYPIIPSINLDPDIRFPWLKELLKLNPKINWINAYIELSMPMPQPPSPEQGQEEPKSPDANDFYIPSIKLIISPKLITSDGKSIRISELALSVDEKAPTKIGDQDGDGILDLNVKFDSAKVFDYLKEINKNKYGTLTNYEVKIRGKLKDGTPFEGKFANKGH